MDNGSTGVPQFEVPQNPNNTGANTGNMLPQSPNYMPQPAAAEVLPASVGNYPGAPLQQPMQQTQQAALPQQMQPPAQQSYIAHPPQSRPSISAHLMAEDTDLIEKEWVEKAKEIVERTRHDPYVQNREITKMKADYMKKRYNKDIRIPED